MARGKGGRRYRKAPPKPETPVKDRLRKIIASRNASSESVDAAQPTTPPTINVNTTLQTSFIDNIGSWFTGQDSSDSLPMDSIDAVSISGNPAPLSKKARKRLKKQDTQTTESDPSTPTDDADSPILDDGDCSQQESSASRTTSSYLGDGSTDSFPLIRGLHDSIMPKQLADPAEKRDSVVSSNWEEAKLEKTSQITTKRVSDQAAWRRKSNPSSWWPCRMYRWTRRFILATIRGFQGPRRADFILTFGVLFVCLYVAYTTLDFILFGLIKGVRAQDIVDAANCSVVYVTIPGPIITVSLIAAAPSDPARALLHRVAPTSQSLSPPF
ncbi:hypothetical protein BU25DRAFT_454835 [Macroventuria anomochaeta]|uniref:Uncharacterized protein n=1 Tax=Macroventuria anomochaeta TaxID=301207 RepID=A0ACB6SAR1_9PLEO|nr:uncharacterized protein BU25DRAFT_454835 [Macroventuria anomochaeta]KAF2631380.1 hypothetical protein BU25DRAFT_454835 [Macroventuria anomochaeta]